MRTSAPGRCKRARGFTLIELLAVLAIIGIGTALAALSLGTTAEAQIKSDARALGQFFNRVAVEAASTGESLQVIAHADALALSGVAVPPPALAARVVALTQAGQAVPPHTPILFAPVVSEAFDLTLDYRGARFLVARDVLGRIAVREVAR